MIRWLRAIWPPWWTLALALLFHLGFEVLHLLEEWSRGIRFYTLTEKGPFL